MLLAGRGLERRTLMLVFTPEVCRPGVDPREVLAAALPHVDVVQVRVKHPENAGWAAPARALHDWTRAALACAAPLCDRAPLIIVNDRVDVALALAPEGVAGVHLGADDCPPAIAREVLGPDAVIGLSTHDVRQVARAGEEPVDYLGFGPVFPSATKGYTQGLGPEAAWVAAAASALPVFPIGGIDATNAGTLQQVGRAAVSAAILAADDPAAAARELRRILVAG